jgi:hypothetical protein
MILILFIIEAPQTQRTDLAEDLIIKKVLLI